MRRSAAANPSRSGATAPASMPTRSRRPRPRRPTLPAGRWSMSLEELGNLGEFVGSIAVLVSLVYLAIQIKKSTETERSSTYRAIVADFTRCGSPKCGCVNCPPAAGSCSRKSFDGKPSTSKPRAR